MQRRKRLRPTADSGVPGRRIFCCAQYAFLPYSESRFERKVVLPLYQALYRKWRPKTFEDVVGQGHITETLKRQVAEEYLSGQGSSMAIAEKYHLRSGNLVLDWVKAYHERNSKRERGGTIMRNDHTIEERLEAVLACLEGGRALQEVAQAHQVAVQTLRSWVKKYQELGPAGLEDRRGKRLADQTPRSRDEALRIENARLKKENELLKMELYLRKKVQELERGDR